MIWTIICFIIAVVVIVVDQITKVIAVDKLSELKDHSYEVIKGVLSFTYVENDGMALGLLDNARWIFMVVSTVAIIGLMVYMIGWRPKSKLINISVGLIIGGGIGNMIDRFFYTGFVGETAGEKVVRDFIDVNIFGDLWPWVFNVADAAVCVGGGLLFIWCVYGMILEAKAEKAKKLVDAAVAVNKPSDNEDEGKDGSEDNKTEE